MGFGFSGLGVGGFVSDLTDQSSPILPPRGQGLGDLGLRMLGLWGSGLGVSDSRDTALLQWRYVHVLYWLYYLIPEFVQPGTTT